MKATTNVTYIIPATRAKAEASVVCKASRNQHVAASMTQTNA
jgi:hypothetical protein